MNSYAYENREGVEPISWEKFAELTRSLAENISEEQIELILGVARAGLFPATLVSCALRRELYPVRITRRVEDEVTFEKPVWRVDVPEAVKGRRVAILDEISDSGETLALVAARARERGASHVVTACLVSHTWANPRPNYSATVSDALIIFPWDEKAYLDGRWQAHPEISEALELQRKTDLRQK